MSKHKTFKIIFVLCFLSNITFAAEVRQKTICNRASAYLFSKLQRLVTVVKRSRSTMRSNSDLSLGRAMMETGNWEGLIAEGLSDKEVLSFVRDALLVGYKNLGIRNPKILIDKIFDFLLSEPIMTIQEKLEYVRNNISIDVDGQSVRAIWSDYYRRAEAPFIGTQIGKRIVGTQLLEVGTGRGWIAYNLKDRLAEGTTVTQTDIFDYRDPEVKKVPSFVFRQVTAENSFPFPDKSFDTAFVVYVLHHLESKEAVEAFLKELKRVTRRKIILLDDTYSLQIEPSGLRPSQSSVSAQFHRLSESQKISALTFSCSFSNRVDGGGVNVSPPRVFLEYGEFVSMLQKIFGGSVIESEYLGIPESKVYLNSEGIFEIIL